MTDHPAADTKTPARGGTEPDGTAPAWSITDPARIARVVMSAYRTHLTAYGLRSTQTMLIEMRAEDIALPRLEGMAEQPADQALRTALPIVADAYVDAMSYYSVFAWAIDAIGARVDEDVEETISWHVRYRDELAGRGADQPAQDESAEGHQAE